MGLDGARGDNELPGDRLIGSAQRYELKYLQLTRAQRFDQLTVRGDFTLRGRDHLWFGIELGEQAAGVVPQRTGAGMRQPLSKQPLHWPALVQEDPHITFWIS